MIDINTVKIHTDKPITKVAVVPSLSKQLVQKASNEKVGLYTTSEWRKSVEEIQEVKEMNFAIIGHNRGEKYGLQKLKELLENKWPDLKVLLQ